LPLAGKSPDILFRPKHTNSPITPIDFPSHPPSLAGYAPDTGPKYSRNSTGSKVPGEKFLSYKKAQVTIAGKHVGVLKDVNLTGRKVSGQEEGGGTSEQSSSEFMAY